MHVLSFYWLNPVTPSRDDLFEVDPDTGEVIVKNGMLLDREKQAVYYLTLQATDGGGQSGTTTLQITLLDVNDNTPVVRGSYNVFVPEGDSDVSVTIQVRATLDLVGKWRRGPCWACMKSELYCVALRKLLSLSGHLFPLRK